MRSCPVGFFFFLAWELFQPILYCNNKADLEYGLATTHLLFFALAKSGLSCLLQSSCVEFCCWHGLAILGFCNRLRTMDL